MSTCQPYGGGSCPPPSTTPTPTTSPPTTTTTTVAHPQGGSLPFTGGDAVGLGLIGGTAVIVGIVMARARRGSAHAR